MSRPIQIDFETLYELASEAREVDGLEHNILALYTLYRRSIQLKRLLLSQKVSIAQKIETIRDLPGFRTSTIFLSLIELLITQEMTDQLYYIHEGFSKIVSKKLNRINIQLFTAVRISEKTQGEIANRLEKMLNKKVILKLIVEPTLLGGTIFKLPDGKIYDFSFNKALSDIKFTLAGKG